MKLNKIIQEQRFDKRIVQWGLRHNVISPKEYQAHLKSLPDLKNKIVGAPSSQKPSLKKTHKK